MIIVHARTVYSCAKKGRTTTFFVLNPNLWSNWPEIAESLDFDSATDITGNLGQRSYCIPQLSIHVWTKCARPHFLSWIQIGAQNVLEYPKLPDLGSVKSNHGYFGSEIIVYPTTVYSRAKQVRATPVFCRESKSAVKTTKNSGITRFFGSVTVITGSLGRRSYCIPQVPIYARNKCERPCFCPDSISVVTCLDLALCCMPCDRNYPFLVAFQVAWVTGFVAIQEAENRREAIWFW